MSNMVETCVSEVDVLKGQGNDHFQLGEVDAALTCYSTALHKLVDPACPLDDRLRIPRQVTLLSNRAMCHLQLFDRMKDQCQLQPCIDDTSQALNLLVHSNDKALRSKLLYRRAKARYLLACASTEVPFESHAEVISLAIQDLMDLLKFEPRHSQAIDLMQSVQKLRISIQHGGKSVLGDTSSPLGRAVGSIRQLLSSSTIDWSSLLPHLYSIMAALSDDSLYVATELGRHGATPILLSIAIHKPVQNMDQPQHKAQMTSCHILSTACSHASFFKRFLNPPILADSSLQTLQNLIPLILQLIKSREGIDPNLHNWMIALIGFLIRFILQLFQYQDDITLTHVDVNPAWINPCQLCLSILSSESDHIQNDVRLPLAILDLLLTWTASDIDCVMASNVDPLSKDTSSTAQRQNTSLTQEQIHSMKPKDIALYQQQLYERKEVAKQRSKVNILTFCQSGGVSVLISCATHTSSLLLEQTCISTLSRLFSPLQDEWEATLLPYLKPIQLRDNNSSFEILEDDGETKQQTDTHYNIKRGILTIALLHSSQDMGAWALSEFLNDLEEFIQSHPRIASQVLSSAASMEKCRAYITPLARTDTVQSLLQSPDDNVASNIASMLAKLGMADAKLSSDEGEIFSLLQVGTQLLFQDKVMETTNSHEDKELSLLERVHMTRTDSLSASVQRGIEILSYIATKTLAKDELAHDYKGSSSQSVMDRLVEICTQNSSMGKTVEAYGIATIFSSLVVSNETLRKEAFQGKEITVEQYDHLQSLGRTDEEKEWEKSRVDVDPPRAVRDRIQKLAQKNVPRAIITLLEDASDTTRDVLMTCMVRMAEEESVRGIMVQQGVLTACIQVISEDHQGSDTAKKRCRLAQHCMAKLLVTTNPNLLTTSQRMGSIKPLIHLVKDNESTDLQQFESLLSLTNLASVDDESKNKIVTEKGISVLHLAMFSDHEMVRRAATEAMSNLLPHSDMLVHLRDSTHMRLWVAFATDVEVNVECSRAATGCLAMASSDLEVATALYQATHFDEMVRTLLQCGNLEILHRLLVLLFNLNAHGSSCREAVVKTGAYAFLERYVQSYQEGNQDMGMTQAELSQLRITVELAKELVRNTK